MPKLSRKLLQSLTKWHYTLGVCFAVVFIYFAITGIFINHSHDLSLDQSKAGWPWLNRHYGIQISSVQDGFHTSAGWVTQQGNTLYLDQLPLGDCRGNLIGATLIGTKLIGSTLNGTALYGTNEADGELISVCSEELLLSLPNGQLVERIALFPEPLKRLHEHNQILFAEGSLSGTHYAFSGDDQWKAGRVPTEAQILKAQNIPQTLAKALNQMAALNAPSPTWERVLLDLHSGRFFGDIGVWLADLGALALLFSSLSGLWMWQSRRKGKKKRRSQRS